MIQLIHKEDNFKKYIKFLKTVAALSRLFSQSPKPYISYRAAENVFCTSFAAENFSRADIAYDAMVDKMCFGIKTFVDNSPWQKIAEFNRASAIVSALPQEEQIRRLASLRNERITFANRLLGNESAYYHCIIRADKFIYLFEEPYDEIDTDNISVVQSNSSNKKTSISFSDSKHDYRYNYSKSTLYKRFVIDQGICKYKIPVTILDNPLDILAKLLRDDLDVEYKGDKKEQDYVILPLYSTRQNRREVPEHSGLNQWNASGRERDFGEVYIPVPMEIHKHFPDFFPPRYESWTLITPSDKKLSAKLCQDNSKALMTNPNNALADWLLRGVLALKEGELLKYDNLERIGVDSARITKLSEKKYRIDFAKVGSYESFIKGLSNTQKEI